MRCAQGVTRRDKAWVSGSTRPLRQSQRCGGTFPASCCDNASEMDEKSPPGSRSHLATTHDRHAPWDRYETAGTIVRVVQREHETSAATVDGKQANDGCFSRAEVPPVSSDFESVLTEASPVSSRIKSPPTQAPPVTSSIKSSLTQAAPVSYKSAAAVTRSAGSRKQGLHRFHTSVPQAQSAPGPTRQTKRHPDHRRSREQQSRPTPGGRATQKSGEGNSAQDHDDIGITETAFLAHARNAELRSDVLCCAFHAGVFVKDS